MRKVSVGIFLCCLCFFSIDVRAAVMTIWGDPADAPVEKTNGVFPGYDAGSQGFVGVNGGFDYSNVYVFQLPTFDPSQQAILAADFSFLDTGNSAQYGVDLYGLHYRAASTVLASDWYSGPNDASNTLIQSAIIPASDTAFQGRITTDATSADANLLNYIKAQYASGATGGDYIFLRLSIDQANALNLNVDFLDNADYAYFVYNSFPGSTLLQWQQQYSPELDLTISPEPAGMLSLSAALAIALMSRRRQ